MAFKKLQPGKVGFSDLAGEIRNQIYSDYFEDGLRLEIACAGARIRPVYNPFHQPKSAEKAAIEAHSAENWTWETPVGAQSANNWPVMRITAKQCDTWRSPTIKKGQTSARYTGTISPALKTGLDDVREKKLGPVYYGQTEKYLFALMLVSKQLHKETEYFHYLATNFVFTSPSLLGSFLTVVPGKRLDTIRSLEIHHSTYGEPRARQDLRWKSKHDKQWHNVCQLAAKKLRNLETLTVSLHITACPLQLDLEEPWVKPLLEFRRLSLTSSFEMSDPTNLRAENVPGAVCFGDDSNSLSSPSLKNVHVYITSESLRPQFFDKPALNEACAETHRVFSNSVENAIMGMNYVDSMREYRKTAIRKLANWRYYLDLNGMRWWAANKALLIEEELEEKRRLSQGEEEDDE